jgi:UDP-N-acetylmuramoylalanine--D-glutamate ligase
MTKKNLKNKKVAVLGLGVEGKDLVEFLLKKKADVSVFDQKDEEKLDFSKLDKKALNLFLGKDYSLDKLVKFDVIYRSPGVYRYLPQLVKAGKRGVEISSAVKLFFELSPSKIIGVTGTKGKGTTATLIYEILKKAGKKVFLAGNIGKPYLALLPKLTKDSWVVLELSSFQLIDIAQSPHIAVVLNITVDHLDWHKDKKEYVRAKENIVRNQKETDYAVINADYKTPKSFVKITKAKTYFFSRKSIVNGCYSSKGQIVLSQGKQKEVVGKVENLLLRGEHNLENVTASVLAARIAGADIKSIKEAVFSFKGLEHRLELVGEIDKISFFNDSFATGPQPTIAAVESFFEPTTLILGGSEKGLDYTELGRKIAERKNISNIILIGEVAGKIRLSLKKAGFKGKIISLGKSSMERIVKKAFAITPKGGVVLLSPAAASFDMFENYKDRGEKFKKVVKILGAK